MQTIQELLRYLIIAWPDLLWLPVAALIVHKGQKLKALFFIIVCLFSLRLQWDFILSLGFNNGLTGWFEMNAFHRGQIVYAIFIAGYLLMSYFSPYTKGPIYLAATMSIYFMAFIASSFIMIV